jgi:uncharacterized membrane protein
VPPALRRVVIPVVVIAIAVASWFSTYAAWLTLAVGIVAHLLVTGTFAASLRSGREPLVATFCRMVRGSVPPECVSYLRRLTEIWVGVMALLTLDLFAIALAEPAWARAALTINFVIIFGLYFGEHAVRVRVFPHLPRYSPFETGRIVMQAMRERR